MEPSFPAFLAAMQNRRLLHLAHKDADCDALGSAYAMSCILPGDIGAAQSIKISARDLADGLSFTPIIDPNPLNYDYTIIYDTKDTYLLGTPLPSQYALFDHHVAGGHRFSDFKNQLAAAAEWCWVQPLESTCAILTDLLLAHNIPITRPMGIALAAGIVTDTAWLRLANGNALRRLAALFDACSLYYEDVLTIIDSPNRKASRRAATLNALKNTREYTIEQTGIFTAQTDTQDNAFMITGALARLGGDIRIVVFPKDGQSMAMIECDAPIVTNKGLDMAALAAKLAQKLDASETWGTAMWGRIVAPTSLQDLQHHCLTAITQALNSP